MLFDSNGNISLNATPVEVHVEKNYFVQDNTSNDTDIFANDYAVIVVEEDLSSYTHLQLTTTTNNFYNSYENIYLTGFPHEITDNSNNSSITVNNSTSLHNEYTSVTNHIINMDSKYLYYRNDNSAGNSGGPVYLKENYNDMEYYSVVAINVSDTTGINLGDEIFPMNANEGVRITTKLLRFYYNNDNLSFWY